MIAYKGFDKNLECRGEKFEIGLTYTKPEKLNPKNCTRDGWHFCKVLSNCFKYYPNTYGNRFCEIEILGNYTLTSDKGITTSFKILRELSAQEVEFACAKNKINMFSIISKAYPSVVLGGSLALLLYGCNIKRDWNDSDLDIQVPYFVKFRKSELGNEIKELNSIDVKNSGNDFDYGFNVDFNECGYTKVDMAIRPKQRYNIIKFNGEDYKVALLEDIWAAKIKYAQQGDKKHIQDLINCLNINIKNIE